MQLKSKLHVTINADLNVSICKQVFSSNQKFLSERILSLQDNWTQGDTGKTQQAIKLFLKLMLLLRKREKISINFLSKSSTSHSCIFSFVKNSLTYVISSKNSLSFNENQVFSLKYHSIIVELETRILLYFEEGWIQNSYIRHVAMQEP